MTIIEKEPEPYEKRCVNCGCLFRFSNRDIHAPSAWVRAALCGIECNMREAVSCPVCHRELYVDKELDMKYDFGSDSTNETAD